ncbi:C-3 sterol dehydrogenase/C-4 decarboxylase [Mollisia scopiformis]|uniref:C-3 sterol dehydrogenase/C-4 decarboxylase n=1 Tax=Mollisia scopiformis TaxID=149040 RepID=A0A194XEW3_MOLSC|nr:C-3 sterol dehydrogenase/C-4 decarboxylase [Mollisia scopiformis]KUJ18307.1 C-3 sterol dehydrogenase/C-4 decarboxylase [Mollisia scopiformis]
MTKDVQLDNVLITGGCNFIGHALVSHILTTSPTTKITILDLPTSLPLFPTVTYHHIPITDLPAIQAALHLIRPTVIFHTACTYSLSLPASTHLGINYQGTLNILAAAQAVGCVKAFVYHSSSSVIEDGYSDLIDARETKPVLFEGEQRFPYPLSKALAERAVLEANGEGEMLTVSIRPAGTFGEADGEMMEKLLGAAKSGRAGVQIGDGKNVYDFLYVGNLVLAHVLAAKALLGAGNGGKVDGEAFHVTNDEPWLFWDFSRRIAKEAGFEVKNVKVVPRWVAMLFAILTEWWVWVSSFGRRESELSRHGVRYSCLTRTLNIEKAKKRLGYKPVFNMEEGVKRSVAWYRENGKLD